MNGLLTFLGIEAWKPVLSALVLPPVPFLLLILVGARLILPRRGLGWLVILLGVAGLWLSSTTAVGEWLTKVALKAPMALTADQLTELKAGRNTAPNTAIVILGGGSESIAPEYGISNLSPRSLERLRYGLWLGRTTGLPVAFSGGLGWGRKDGTSEAQTASRIATQEFGQPLKWVEEQSRDTRENALRTVPLLKQAGITHVVLVTHGWHMPRAQQLFQQAAGPGIRIQPAPMGLARGTDRVALQWLPSPEGYASVSMALREMVASVLGV